MCFTMNRKFIDDHLSFVSGHSWTSNKNEKRNEWYFEIFINKFLFDRFFIVGMASETEKTIELEKKIDEDLEIPQTRKQLLIFLIVQWVSKNKSNWFSLKDSIKKKENNDQRFLFEYLVIIFIFTLARHLCIDHGWFRSHRSWTRFTLDISFDPYLLFIRYWIYIQLSKSWTIDRKNVLIEIWWIIFSVFLDRCGVGNCCHPFHWLFDFDHHRPWQCVQCKKRGVYHWIDHCSHYDSPHLCLGKEKNESFLISCISEEKKNNIFFVSFRWKHSRKVFI